MKIIVSRMRKKEHVEEVKARGIDVAGFEPGRGRLDQTVEPSLVLGRKGRELVDRSPDNRSETRKHPQQNDDDKDYGETDWDLAFGKPRNRWGADNGEEECQQEWDDQRLRGLQPGEDNNNRSADDQSARAQAWSRSITHSSRISYVSGVPR
jgi:hypothetical protein